MSPMVVSRAARLTAVALGIACAVVLLTGCSGIPGIYTVEHGDASAGPGISSRVFDASGYAARVWDSQVVPTALDKAVDADELFAAIRVDPSAASQRYGRQAGAGAPFTFLVKGSGPVTAVSQGSAVGSVEVAVTGVQGVTVALTVGPAFVGTAVRDSMDFIDFGQFTNQLDYAAAATALNERVKTSVVNVVDPATITGKHVEFVGAFQLLDPKSVLVTPIVLKVLS